MPEENFDFVGRVEQLESLNISLNKFNTSVINQAVATGMGGIGKTQLALKYAHLNKHQYQAILWFRAEKALEGQYYAFIKENEKEFNVDTLNLSEANIVQTTYKMLADKKTLIILDNVGCREDIKGILAYHYPNTHIIITSRSQFWDKLIPINLPVFDFSNVGDYVAHYLKNESQEAIKALTKELGGLPLAITQAVACMYNLGTSIKVYLDNFQKKMRDLLDRPGFESDYDNFKTVYTTWDISFDALKAKEEFEAIKVVLFCAYISPDAIPHFLIEKLCKTDKFSVLNLLKKLREFSLIDIEDDNAFRMHRLLQAVVRSKLESEENIQAFQKSNDEAQPNDLKETLKDWMFILNNSFFNEKNQFIDHIKVRDLILHSEVFLSLVKKLLFEKRNDVAWFIRTQAKVYLYLSGNENLINSFEKIKLYESIVNVDELNVEDKLFFLSIKLEALQGRKNLTKVEQQQKKVILQRALRLAEENNLEVWIAAFKHNFLNEELACITQKIYDVSGLIDGCFALVEAFKLNQIIYEFIKLLELHENNLNNPEVNKDWSSEFNYVLIAYTVSVANELKAFLYSLAQFPIIVSLPAAYYLLENEFFYPFLFVDLCFSSYLKIQSNNCLADAKKYYLKALKYDSVSLKDEYNFQVLDRVMDFNKGGVFGFGLNYMFDKILARYILYTEEVDDYSKKALGFYNFGKVFSVFGKNNQALTLFEKAEEIFRKLDKKNEVDLLIKEIKYLSAKERRLDKEKILKDTLNIQNEKNNSQKTIELEQKITEDEINLNNENANLYVFQPRR